MLVRKLRRSQVGAVPGTVCDSRKVPNGRGVTKPTFSITLTPRTLPSPLQLKEPALNHEKLTSNHLGPPQVTRKREAPLLPPITTPVEGQLTSFGSSCTSNLEHGTSSHDRLRRKRVGPPKAIKESVSLGPSRDGSVAGALVQNKSEQSASASSLMLSPEIAASVDRRLSSLNLDELLLWSTVSVKKAPLRRNVSSLTLPFRGSLFLKPALKRRSTSCNALYPTGSVKHRRVAAYAAHAVVLTKTLCGSNSTTAFGV